MNASPRALCRYTNGGPSPACMRTVGRPLRSMVSGWPPLLARSTRAPNFSFLRRSSIDAIPDVRSLTSDASVRHHLAREHFHALARQFVRHRPGLASREHDAAAEFLLPVLQLLPDRGRAADDGEHALLDVVPALLGVKEVRLVLQDRQGRLRRRVAGG